MKAETFTILEKGLLEKPIFSRRTELVLQRDLNTSRSVKFQSGFRQPIGASHYSLPEAFELAARAYLHYKGEDTGTARRSVEYNFVNVAGTTTPHDTIDAWIMQDGHHVYAYIDGSLRTVLEARKGDLIVQRIAEKDLKNAYNSMRDQLAKRFPKLEATEIVPGREKFLFIG